MSKQLDLLLAEVEAIVVAHAGLRVNGKVASLRTQEYSLQMMSETCRRLHRLGFYLESVKGLSAKHVDELVKDWHASGHQNKTMQNQYSRLKIFCGWAGKKGILHPDGFPGHLPGIPRESLKVSTIAEKSKSWSGNGVDVIAALGKAQDEDARWHAMLLMGVAFGLRKKEVLRIKPWRADKGHSLEIDGAVAKNGRFRVIHIAAGAYGEFQRFALDTAKGVCVLSPTEWPPKTIKLTGMRSDSSAS